MTPHDLLDRLLESCLFDAELAIAACGDWARGPRVEDASLSGCAAAGRLLGLRPGPAQPTLFEDAG
jgi:predicted NAD/FAD-dependent oxidoreductase